jgi:hypothetical protein
MTDEVAGHAEGGFTDEDFERRYYSPEATVPSAAGSGNPGHSGNRSANPGAARKGGGRNKFMRALLRRRMAASASN